MSGSAESTADGVGRLPEDLPGANEHGGGAAATGGGQAATGALNRLIDRLARRVKSVHLMRLIQHRGQVLKALGSLPQRMHLVANQTQLVLELAEDYRTGVYREIPWRSIAVLVAIAAYIFSPLDIIPDALAGFGVIDDMLLMGIGARLMRRDLEAYCTFKGYDPEFYFGKP